MKEYKTRRGVYKAVKKIIDSSIIPKPTVIIYRDSTTGKYCIVEPCEVIGILQKGMFGVINHIYHESFYKH